MGQFSGFECRDFDYFISHPHDYTSVLRQKLEEFAKLVHRSALPQRIQRAYPQCHVGHIQRRRGRGAWVRIGKAKPPPKRDPFINSNLTIEIDPEALTFNAVIRDQRATRTGYPIARLHDALVSEETALTGALNGLPEGWQVVLFERVGDGDHPPNRIGEIWLRRATLDLELDFGVLRPFAVDFLREIEFPGVHVGTRIYRCDPILLHPEELVHEAGRSLTAAFEVLKALDPAL